MFSCDWGERGYLGLVSLGCSHVVFSKGQCAIFFSSVFLDIYLLDRSSKITAFCWLAHPSYAGVRLLPEWDSAGARLVLLPVPLPPICQLGMPTSQLPWFKVWPWHVPVTPLGTGAACWCGALGVPEVHMPRPPAAPAVPTGVRERVPLLCPRQDRLRLVTVFPPPGQSSGRPSSAATFQSWPKVLFYLLPFFLVFFSSRMTNSFIFTITPYFLCKWIYQVLYWVDPTMDGK